jgi:hypothetical protein
MRQHSFIDCFDATYVKSMIRELAVNGSDKLIDIFYIVHLFQIYDRTNRSAVYYFDIKNVRCCHNLGCMASDIDVRCYETFRICSVSFC